LKLKKGDIVSKDTNLVEGTIVLHNCSSQEIAKAFMETDFFQEFGVTPAYELVPDEDNPTSQAVVLRSPVIKHEEAKVNWVVENEVALQFKDGGCAIITITEEPEWKVIQESVPSYQSSVAEMSDEQLRSAIDDLRNQRTFITSKPRKTREKSEVIDKNDPMAVALASMPEDKKLELMKKLGMVD
jgi:hypothetical protein